jgi:DNA (cytosine-5)-methyltransferase 1
MNLVDLCCGAGGFSLGLGYTGMTPAAAFDNWPPALAVYRENVGRHAFKGDLSRPRKMIRKIEQLAPDLIVGEPPCQDFSTSGSRIEGPRAALTVKFAEAIVAVAPCWFVFENVPSAATSKSFRAAR